MLLTRFFACSFSLILLTCWFICLSAYFVFRFWRDTQTDCECQMIMIWTWWANVLLSSSSIFIKSYLCRCCYSLDVAKWVSQWNRFFGEWTHTCCLVVAALRPGGHGRQHSPFTNRVQNFLIFFIKVSVFGGHQMDTGCIPVEIQLRHCPHSSRFGHQVEQLLCAICHRCFSLWFRTVLRCKIQAQIFVAEIPSVFLFLVLNDSTLSRFSNANRRPMKRTSVHSNDGARCEMCLDNLEHSAVKMCE